MRQNLIINLNIGSASAKGDCFESINFVYVSSRITLTHFINAVFICGLFVIVWDSADKKNANILSSEHNHHIQILFCSLNQECVPKQEWWTSRGPLFLSIFQTFRKGSLSHLADLLFNHALCPSPEGHRQGLKGPGRG